MKRFSILLACFLPAAFASGLDVRATATSGDASRLFDGVIDDRTAFHGEGVPLAIEMAFSEPRVFVTLRLHPGFRGIADMPSTEASPRELIVSAWTGDGWVSVTDRVVIPRDPGRGTPFVVDIPLREQRTDRLKIDVLSTHDTGRRLGSGEAAVVPPGERSVYIRQIELVSKAHLADQAAEQQRLAGRAGELLRRFEKRAAAGDALGTALMETYAQRARQLDEARAATFDELQNHYDWFRRQVAPYLEARFDAGNGTPEILLRATVEEPNTPAAFPVDFRLLERASGRVLSRNGAEVHVLDKEGNPSLQYSYLELLTPDRGLLHWALDPDASYWVRFLPPGQAEAPPRRLLGTGDHMMRDHFTDSVFPPGDFWSARTADLFDSGRQDLVAGFFTDYAHIYKTKGTDGAFTFDDRWHFVARDPFDRPIATTDYHGRATAIADPVDLDGSGRIDLVLSRFNAEMPLFVRNIGRHPGALEYDEPRLLTSLRAGHRYAYGDLDGNGIADAVGVRSRGERVEVSFWRGSGEEQDGAPRFENPVELDVDIPDSVQYNRRTAGRSPVVSLDDLNGNGRLDLSVLAPPYLYVAFARPGNEPAFDPPQRVLYDDGVAFNSGFYFPHFGWQDLDGDGIPDLMLTPGLLVHYAADSVLTLHRERTRVPWLRQQARLFDPSLGMAGFDIADLTGDGAPDFLQVDNTMQLRMHPYRDGVFGERISIPLEEPGAERYGCPDMNEYAHLYAQVKAVDLDGDGLPDLLLNTEHNWRFGYFSFYRNLGDGRFAPEVALAPKPDTSHLRTVRSPGGKALVVDGQTSLDYLTLESAGVLSPQGGRIVFSYSPLDREIGNAPRTFFSSGFWRRAPSLATHGLYAAAHALYDLYLYSKTVEDLFARMPYFALLQMPDGTLRCQVGNDSFATSAPVTLDPGTYYTFEVHWNAAGTRLLLEGRQVAASKRVPERFADRIHLGSLAWLGMQRDREYPSRWEAHPVDFSFPANGRFDFFRFENPAGRMTLQVDFDRHLAGLDRRSRISYRSTPGFTTYQGRPAMIAHFGDHRRQEKGEDKAVLHVIPFKMEPGHPPRFEEAIPLTREGRPFHAFSRTQVVPVDWNANGHPDLLLSPPGFATSYNRGVEVFLNDGNWNFIRTPDPDLERLNELLHAHHDTKLVPASLLGNREPDLATWSDPGLRVYSRPFLRRGQVVFRVEAMRLRGGG